MHGKTRRMVAAIFADPVNGTLEWRRIEAALVALGAEVVEGNGSRITILLNGRRADFHRPHPGKEALRYRVKAVRELLIQAGVTA